MQRDCVGKCNAYCKRIVSYYYEEELSLFWFDNKCVAMLYCHCVTYLSFTCTIYFAKNKHEINVESRFY